MSADSDAYKAARAVPGISEVGAQYLTTVARGEGFYGLGWGNPSAKAKSDSAAFGLTGFEGVGSRNWGAVMGIGDSGTFFHVDYKGANSDIPFKGTFKRYSSDAVAAQDMARILLKPNVLAALDKRDLMGAVAAQKANGYFGLALDKYQAAVKRNYTDLTHALGWEPLLLGATPLPLVPGSGGLLPPEQPTTRSGRVYIVKRGDSAWAIAYKLCGAGGRWPELRDVNSHMNPPLPSVWVGEGLNLPESWIS